MSHKNKSFRSKQSFIAQTRNKTLLKASFNKYDSKWSGKLTPLGVNPAKQAKISETPR